MTTELALTRPEPSLTMDVLRAQMEAAKRYVDSGLLPSGIKTPQQALTIMQVGREVGVPATYALRNIHVISGKPTCSAELLMALVRRSYGQSAIRVKEASNDACTVEYREVGWDGISSLTFSMDDAKKAKLDSKDMWKAYPRAMLRSRAVSEAVRTAFPECIAGLYTPEEMGASVRVTSSGELEIDSGDEPPRLALVEQPSQTTVNDAATAAEIEKLQARWFATVRGTSLDGDEARHRFVAQWTADEWPKAKRTDSLKTAFARMTKAEAEDFLVHVQTLCLAERAELLADLLAGASDDLGDAVDEEQAAF